MEAQQKGFWKFFAMLVFAAAVSLAGAIIGKTTVGYILYFAGLAAAVALLVFCFIKTGYFKGEQRRPLILGLVVSILLVSSILLLTTGGRISTVANRTNMLSGLTGGTARSYYTGGTGGNFQSGGTFTGRSGSFSGGTGGFSGGTGTGGTRTFNNFSTTGSSSGTTTSSAYSSAMSAAATRRILDVVLGWALLVASAIVLLIALIRFFTKKVSYAQGRWKTLLLGILLGGLLAASTTVTVAAASTTRRAYGNFSPTAAAEFQSMRETAQAEGTTMPGASQGANQPGSTQSASAASQTPAATATVTATPAPTSTPLPTSTPTVEEYSSLVACLNPDIQYGINIRNFPSDTATNVGSIPAANCFTIDGQAAQYPGWYHLASGQNGLGGINFSVDETKVQLWVNGKTITSPGSDILDLLPKITVPQK